MEGQQVLHGFWKGFAVKLLQEGDGVSADIPGVPAHVRRSLIRRLSISTVVWSADPQYLIAQMTQQLRQICSSGNLHFSVCKAISDFA